MKTFFLYVMIFSGLIGGLASGQVSARLKKYVYFDSVLFKEAKNGSKIARISLVAHAVMFIGLIGWFYLSLY